MIPTTWINGVCRDCASTVWPAHAADCAAMLRQAAEAAALVTAGDDPTAWYNRPSRDVGGSWERGDDGVPGPGAGNWGGL